METLLLLETASQAAWLGRCGPGLAKYTHILAITPVAAYACQQSERPYLKLEDHAQISRRRAEYSSILPDYLEWETWLDKWLQTRVPEFGAGEFTPARNATFMLQLLHAEIWSTSVNLQEFFDQVRPDSLALWPPAQLTVPWFLHPLISPLTVLAPSLARARNIEIVDLADQFPEQIPGSPVSPVPRFSHRAACWLKGQIRQSKIAAEITALHTVGPAEYLKQLLSAAPRVLASGNSHDLSTLVHAIRRQGSRVTHLPDELPPARLFAQRPRLSHELTAILTSVEKQLFEEPRLWEPIERCGLDRTRLWSEPLRFWWRQVVPESWLRYQQIQRSFSRHRYAAFVTWDAGANTLSSAAVNAATTARVPRYIYQHGGSAHNDAKLWQMYLRQSEVFLVYGEETIAELKRTQLPCLEPAARLIPVGSARLDSIRAQHNPEKNARLRDQLQGGDSRPIILYIPSHFNGYGRAIGDLAAYPDVSYFELQQRILSLWIESPNIRLLYKHFVVANNINHVMPDFIERHIPNGKVTTQRLVELMWAVDAIVLDHTITALGEVLLTRKPLVVYMPKPNASDPDAARRLRRRAVVAETPLEFEAHVRALLQAGQYPELANPSTEFLQAYCTNLDDGRSVERAADVILHGINRT